MTKTVVTRHPISWMFDSLRRQAATPARARPERLMPAVRPITSTDLHQALRAGFDDFTACRTDAILLCIVYPLAGLLMSRMVMGYRILPLIFPLVAGFALLGPPLATGLYELSRRREQNEPLSWGATFAPFRSPAIGSMITLGLGLLAIFTLWLVAAGLLYDATLGPNPPISTAAFIHSVLHTVPGLIMTVLGIGIGAIFAFVVLAISVVSFPLLLDRDCGVEIAIRTSLLAVRTNRNLLVAWGLIVAAGLALGSLPFLIGLAVVMPALAGEERGPPRSGGKGEGLWPGAKGCSFLKKRTKRLLLLVPTDRSGTWPESGEALIALGPHLDAGYAVRAATSCHPTSFNASASRSAIATTVKVGLAWLEVGNTALPAM
jgi:uncharacterized membrane protein